MKISLGFFFARWQLLKWVKIFLKKCRLMKANSSQVANECLKTAALKTLHFVIILHFINLTSEISICYFWLLFWKFWFEMNLSISCHIQEIGKGYAGPSSHTIGWQMSDPSFWTSMCMFTMLDLVNEGAGVLKFIESSV